MQTENASRDIFELESHFIQEHCARSHQIATRASCSLELLEHPWWLVGQQRRAVEHRRVELVAVVVHVRLVAPGAPDAHSAVETQPLDLEVITACLVAAKPVRLAIDLAHLLVVDPGHMAAVTGLGLGVVAVVAHVPVEHLALKCTLHLRGRLLVAPDTWTFCAAQRLLNYTKGSREHRAI
jgi:hypothetical protein